MTLFRADSSSFLERDEAAAVSHRPAYSSIDRSNNQNRNQPENQLNNRANNKLITNRHVRPNYRSVHQSNHRPQHRSTNSDRPSIRPPVVPEADSEDVSSEPTNHTNNRSTNQVVDQSGSDSVTRSAQHSSFSKGGLSRFIRICWPSSRSINLSINLLYLIFTLITVFYASYTLSHIARLCSNLSMILINLSINLSISYAIAIAWLAVRYQRARVEWALKFIDRLKRSAHRNRNRATNQANEQNDNQREADDRSASQSLLSDYNQITNRSADPSINQSTCHMSSRSLEHSVDHSPDDTSANNQPLSQPNYFSRTNSYPIDQGRDGLSVSKSSQSASSDLSIKQSVKQTSKQSMKQSCKRCCTKSCTAKYLFVAYQIILFFLCVFIFGVTLFIQAKTSVRITGALALGRVRNPVTVSRDVSSYIHIEANDWHDAYYCQGVVVMQSRMWQIEMQRLIGQGRVSEVLGDNVLSGVDTLLIDQSSRLVDYYGAAERSLNSLSNDTISHLTAFVNGMNDYLDTDPPLQLEFWVLGLSKPEPFTEVDVLVFAKLFSYILAGNIENELERMELLIVKNVTTDRIDQLLPPYDTERWPTIIPSHQSIDQLSSHTAFQLADQTNSSAPEPIVDWYQVHCGMTPKSHVQTINQSIKQLRSFFGQSRASNAWVVGGEHTLTGEPLLANDPHLTFTAPSLFLLIHLEVAPEHERDQTITEDSDLLRIVPFDQPNGKTNKQSIEQPGPPGPPNHGSREEVIGASLMGIPGVLIGHNNATAWGVTNSGADAQDLFVLIDSADRSAYMYNESWVSYQLNNQTIKMKGQTDVEFVFRTSIYGPVISDLDPSINLSIDQSINQTTSHFNNQSSSQCSFSLSWVSLFDNDTSLDGYLSVMHAQSFDQFQVSLKSLVGPSENYLYASRRETDNQPTKQSTGQSIKPEIERSKGDIGYQLTGLIPIRRNGHTGKFPAPGDGSYNWQGFVSFADMPSMHNPPAGYIVTANNRVTMPSTNQSSNPFISADWDELSEGMRAARIIQMLTHGGNVNHTLETMRKIQDDQKSLLYSDFKPLIQMLQPSTNQGLIWQSQMQLFDGEMMVDSQEATVFQLFMKSLARVTIDEIGRSNSNPVYLYNVFVKGQAEDGCDHYQSLIQSINRSIKQTSGKSIDQTQIQSETEPRPSVGCLTWASDQWDAVIDESTSAPTWGHQVKPALFKHQVLGDGWLSCLANRVVQHGGDDYTVNVGHLASDDDSMDPSDQSCASDLSFDRSVNQLLTLTNIQSTNTFQTHGPSYRQVIDLSNFQSAMWQNTLGNGGDLFAAGYDQELPQWANDDLASMRTMMIDRNLVQFISRNGREPFDPNEDD